MNAIIGDNGIITKAQEAKKLSEKASDEEILKLMFTENMMNDNGKMSVGQELFDRTVENGDKWNIIVEKETGEVYGTGYYYIPKGTKLQNGQEATTNWLVDKDGKMKELFDGTFTELDYTSTLGVTEGLVFNMDASNIEKGSSSWGNGITLRYYDKETYSDVDKVKQAYNEQLSFDSVSKRDEGYDRYISESSEKYFDEENMSLTFDGSNYVEIYREGGFDFSKGFTFELFGSLKDFNVPMGLDKFLPLVSIWDGRYGFQPQTRFGFIDNSFLYSLSLFCGLDWFGDWEYPGAGWNQWTDIKRTPLDSDIYMTLTLSKTDNFVVQTLYVDGKKVNEGNLNLDYYKSFLGTLPESKWIDVGRCSMSANRKLVLFSW